MSQKEMGRVHLALDTPELTSLKQMAKVGEDQGVTLGILILAMVLCCIAQFEKSLSKGKKVTLHGVCVDPSELPRLSEVNRMHVYFGKHRDVLERLDKLADQSDKSVSWLVRQACRVCLPVFKKHVPFKRSFKCCGVNVGF